MSIVLSDRVNNNLASQTISSYDWWASLNHGGLLIAPAKLTEFFITEDLHTSLRYGVRDRLRREVVKWQQGGDTSNRSPQLSALLDVVLEDFLGLGQDAAQDTDRGTWLKGSALDRSWARQGITGESIKPQRVWQEVNGGALPVFVESEVARLGIGRGKRSVSRVNEWLRKANYKIALLTNGQQWRLIHAGVDYDAWCEWDLNFWFMEGELGLQAIALQSLLNVRSLTYASKDKPSPLITAISASRQGQAELSDVLGERVRKAVELLIESSSSGISQLLEGNCAGTSLTPRHFYIAATRTIMRLVIILFAEARDLLPRENGIYHNSYGIQGLREQLDRLSGGRGAERLRSSESAWARVLALLRLVYLGSAHEKLPIPAYGGSLFAPSDRHADDPILIALSAFENLANCPSDAVVHKILELLTRSKVKVRQGRGSTWVEAPVDFSDLSSEYIGILYEGLLDFELRQADRDQPMVFLNLGDQPVLPLTRLENMTDKAIASLVEKLKQKDKSNSEDEDTVSDDEVEEVEELEEEVEESDLDVELDSSGDSEGDRYQQIMARSQAWAERAVKVGKLVSGRLKGKAYEDAARQLAKALVVRVVLPEAWYLVRWGGTRKGSGTFYTRPQLAVPTVRQTLLSLVYEDGGLIPKPPEIILSLKICDPAMGSGSFPVAAVRFLTKALYESLWHYGKIEAHGDRTLCRLADGTGTNSLLDETLPLLSDHPDFEEMLKARLKRYVVERCIYGVDLDPLAVELAKMALWIETMDRSLAFGFLDHKLKCGNALVGCWFDQFREYPVMAWERKGGDETHKPVHHFRENKGKQVGDKWTQAIKDLRNGEVKEQLKGYLEVLNPQMRLNIPEVYLPEPPEQIYAQALELFNKLHGDLHQPDYQQEQYKLGIEKSDAFQKLRQAFDLWCAIWFWSGEYLDKNLDIVPTPNHFFNPSEQVREIANNIAKEFRFFHWEIEFPDVFAGAGFDAVIGNPPWEIQKPNSKEFFSNIDPLYRTYGKQEALDYQKQYFTNNPQIETDWIAYNDRLKAVGNYFKYAGFAFGDPTVGDGFTLSRKKPESENLHDLWRERRQKYLSYAEKIHPFRYQGSADINTYKLFLEFGLGILRSGGKLGLIVPSGVYTDKGSTDLRTLFLERNQWEWLFGFENRDGIFSSVDERFKFNPIIAIKGGKTENIKATFMQRSLSTWENPDRYVRNYPIERVSQFSPNSMAILEILSDRDLLVLEKMYANGILLGDQSDRGWGINFATEFHMTAHSKLFPPRPQWEAKGYRADEYGHWLKGDWCELAGAVPDDAILSSDRTYYIKISNVEDVALPLYQGLMLWQFDSATSDYVSGRSSRAQWKSRKEYKSTSSIPQYLMSLNSIKEKLKQLPDFRLAFRAVQNATNQRTMITSLIAGNPCGHSIMTIQTEYIEKNILALICLCSFPFDFVLRRKMSQNNVSLFYLEEIPTPYILSLNDNLRQKIFFMGLGLSATLQIHIPCWVKLTKTYPHLKANSYSSYLAITPYERLRLRSILDAIVAELYGLEIEDFACILKDSDLPKEQSNDKTYSRTLDAKGFWRIDKDKDPELRHTVLSQIAFQELKKIGLEAFLNLNNGEGWMIPDTIRLADYGLGHDDRAQTHQPVAERLGARYLDWQLQSTPEASWLECERHAANLQKLLGNNPTTTPHSQNSPPIQTDLFGNLLQTDLFGNIIENNKKR